MHINNYVTHLQNSNSDYQLLHEINCKDIFRGWVIPSQSGHEVDGLSGLRGLRGLRSLRGLRGLSGLRSLRGLRSLSGLSGLSVLSGCVF